MPEPLGFASSAGRLPFAQSARSSKGGRPPRTAVGGGRAPPVLGASRPRAGPAQGVRFAGVRSMDSESGDGPRDVGLQEEINLLEAEVGSLKEERDRALTIADNSAKRSARLRESMEKLNDSSFKAMRLGDESASRKLLQEKATVSIAQTKAHSRAEANVALAKKLNEILRIRQTKLINLYTNHQKLQYRAMASASEADARPTSGEPFTPRDVNARPQGGSAGGDDPASLSSRKDDESPSWEDEGDDGDSMARSRQPFSSEDDLEEAFLDLERETLERMLEISPRDGDVPPWKEDKPS